MAEISAKELALAGVFLFEEHKSNQSNYEKNHLPFRLFANVQLCAGFRTTTGIVVSSAFADETRKRRRYFAFLEKFTRHTEVESAFGSDGAADERLRALLEQKLTALPPEERQLIVQKYFAGRAVREIADAGQTTEKAVESKLSRVRRKLKDGILSALKIEKM